MTDAEREEIATFKADCQRTINSATSTPQERQSAHMFLFIYRRWDMPTLEEIKVAMDVSVATKGNGHTEVQIGPGKNGWFKVKSTNLVAVTRVLGVVGIFIVIILVGLIWWDMDHIKEHMGLASEIKVHDNAVTPKVAP